MTSFPSPSVFALRAVREYRRRDIVPYLALRYYLDNRSARRERWATDIATELVLRRTVHPYLAVKQFKTRDEQGRVVFRDLHFPGANEALAEIVLLAECAKLTPFHNRSSVFSYELSQAEEADGAFRPYLPGLRRRHNAIARACRANARAVVHYADIRTFYPSIRIGTALDAWRDTCLHARLPKRFLILGERMMNGHASVERAGDSGLLTGPVLTHLLGNLVLRKLDDRMEQQHDVAYFRYVDDIVLVGTEAAVAETRRVVSEVLSSIGLELHGEESAKHLVVDAEMWLHGEHDFRDDPQPVQWKTLVGALKWMLVSSPERHDEIQGAFRSAGFRIPILDYHASTRDASYLGRLRRLVSLPWLQHKRRNLGELLKEARALRARYFTGFHRTVTTLETADAYQRRRAVSALRYYAGRLAYLADPAELEGLARQLRGIQELEFHATVLACVASGDVTPALELGSNVAQAVAQVLRADGRDARVQKELSREAVRNLAAFPFSGVRATRAVGAEPPADELLRIAESGSSLDLMQSSDAFVRELASLHGLGGGPRHAEVLGAAFDSAEDSVFDAVSAMFSAS